MLNPTVGNSQRATSQQMTVSALGRVGLVVLILAGGGCFEPPPAVQSRTALVDTCRGIEDGAYCDDKNVCTSRDRCAGGICVGEPAPEGMTCTDGNLCTTGDSCRGGVCTSVPVADGTSCTDDDACTTPDACRAGQCVPGPALGCDDGIACTLDTCVASSGCQFKTTSACPDGDAGGQTDGNVANSDGVTPDDRPAVEVGGAGGFDGARDADAAMGADAAEDVAADTGLPPDAGAGADAEVDAPVDAPLFEDAQGPADALSDAVDGLDRTDASDAAAPTFQVRGGACSCALPVTPSAPASVGLCILGASLLFARRRRRTRAPLSK